MRPPNVRRPRIGFSLVEVLVVLGILALLMSLILPAVQRTRDAASRADCQNRLRQIGIALHNYHDTNGRLPPRKYTSNLDRDPDNLLSWLALILPQMDQLALWAVSDAACRVNRLPYQNPPHVGYATVMKPYVCPSDARLLSTMTTPKSGTAAFGSYVGVSGSYDKRGALGAEPGCRLADITDGTSSTLLAGERPPPASLQVGRWYQSTYVLEHAGLPEGTMKATGEAKFVFDYECASFPASYGPGRLDNPCDRMHFWSFHTGGSNFVLCDGSVRYLPYTISHQTLGALATRSNGESVNLD